MTSAPFETMRTSHPMMGPIPIHPQPGIFETTIAFSEVFANEFGAEYGVIEAKDVEKILEQPAWDVRDLITVVQRNLDSVRRHGWGHKTDNGRDHYWEPVVVEDGDWRSVGAVCMRHGGKVGREATLVLTEEPTNARCGSCVNRLNMREIEKEHS